MLNQSILVGRIVREPEVRETEAGVKVSNITLAVPRSYKNVNGEYDTDFISCVLLIAVTPFDKRKPYKYAAEYVHSIIRYNNYIVLYFLFL